MFEKVFQDYEGYVEGLIGLKVSSLKALIDQENNDETILIWIGVNDIKRRCLNCQPVLGCTQNIITLMNG